MRTIVNILSYDTFIEGFLLLEGQNEEDNDDDDSWTWSFTNNKDPQNKSQLQRWMTEFCMIHFDNSEQNF